MKRLFSAVLLLCLIFALAAPAAADVAYEPQDNFYERHRDDCRYENRSWYTNGAEGFVLVYASPTDSAEGVLPNGARCYVSYTYKGAWGCVDYNSESSRDTGWVKLSDMVPDYDHRAFDADHRSEYVQKEASLTIGRTDVIFCYKYPGSGIVVDELSGAWAAGEMLGFSEVFTDPAGREWVCLGYFMGHRNCWICLSDPFSDALEPDENFVSPTVIPAADEAAMAAALKTEKAPSLYLYAGAAGVVILAAAVLFAVLRRKKKA